MLEQLQAEIEQSLAERGDEIFTALLASLEARIKQLNLTTENQALYAAYIRDLFAYVTLKRDYIFLRRKYDRDEKVGHKPGDQFLRRMWNVSHAFDIARDKKKQSRDHLKSKNLPFKFLHPNGWDYLGQQRQQCHAKYCQ